MELKGISTVAKRVTIEINPIDAFRELKKEVFKSRGVDTDWRVIIDRKTKLPIIVVEEYSHHNGDPYDVVVNNNPTPELVTFLSMWNELYNQVRDINSYVKPNTDKAAK